jgi:hypothetical protein
MVFLSIHIASAHKRAKKLPQTRSITELQKCDGRIYSFVALSPQEKLTTIVANNKFECM